MRNAFLPAATVSLALAACSSGGSTPFSPGAGGGDDAGSPSDSGSGADTSSVDPGAYPPGPYGATTGATLIDFQADGYRLTPSQTDSTKVAWSTGIDVAEYHRNPACKCLMVTIGATWCSACQVEQPTLVKEVAA